MTSLLVFLVFKMQIKVKLKWIVVTDVQPQPLTHHLSEQEAARTERSGTQFWRRRNKV